MPYKLLDLPEGRIHVARYLDLIDFKCCTLVSKPWHHDFQPFVWRIWAARARESHTAAHIQDIDSLNTIRKNASYIRHLSLLTWVGPMDPDLNQILRNHCRRLDTLEAIAHSEDEQFNVAEIVMVNPQLRSLHIQRGQGSNAVQNGHHWLAFALNGLPHLYELHLDYSLMEAAALQILEASPSLKRLTVATLSSKELSLLVERQFQSLEALEVVIKDFAPEDMACLFTKFRRLRKLKLRTPGGFDIRHIIATPWTICSTIEVLHFPFGILRVCQDETLKQYAAVEKEQEGSSLEEWQQAQRVFMKRLGECTRLRSIWSLMATKDTSPGSQISGELSWHLETGLDHLSQLTCLEELAIEDPTFEPHTEDMQFMKRQWRSLRGFYS
ncbi:hypothetical protein BGZ73_001860 [Actinomortierella ambigua]|nr:hypothetical protein BGZ73_001860 [Actinomortierella ambigua]